MTREEYETLVLPEILEGRYAQALMTKDQYITSLEARIAGLEATKTCEGCEYLSPETDDDYEFCKKGKACIRWELHLPDYYKTKETK